MLLWVTACCGSWRVPYWSNALVADKLLWGQNFFFLILLGSLFGFLCVIDIVGRGCGQMSLFFLKQSMEEKMLTFQPRDQALYFTEAWS